MGHFDTRTVSVASGLVDAPDSHGTTVSHSIRLSTLLLAVLSCLALPDRTQARPSVDLLTNGGFEKVTEGNPVGWEARRWSGDATLAVAPQGYRGQRCITVASETGADFSLATQVAVEPYATYRLSGWIKTENVRAKNGLGALINIHDFDSAISPALTDTHDWTRVEVVFSTCGQEHIWVHCCLGGWGQVTGKAWYDELSLELLGRYKLDYSYLFRTLSHDVPRVAHYGGQTAIAGHAFQGPPPQLVTGKDPVRWRLLCGPEGMTVDDATGAPAWPSPRWGHHRVLILARNTVGYDILEFIVMVVKDDMPGAEIAVTQHMDFVLPPAGARWFEKWRPHALLDAQFAYLRKLIGHEPAHDGKQVVKYRPDMWAAHSGNPAMIGQGFWNFDDVGGWNLGIWFHEVGHNFNAQAPVTFYSDIEGFGNPYHHHCSFLSEPLFLRTVADPAAFGLTGVAAENYRRWTEQSAKGLINECKGYADWQKTGGTLRTYEGDHFHLWTTFCDQLTSQYGAEILEKTLRAMRTDGVPATLRETAKTPLQVNALQFSIMSHAAGADLRDFFRQRGCEFDDPYYQTIDAKVAEIIQNLPDEDDLDGWKKCPHNGHYYRRTTVDTNWCAAEVEARQFGGHLATIRNPQELAWLQSRFGIYPELWLGGFQTAKRRGVWSWISGEHSLYAHWDQSQPVNDAELGFAFLLTGSGKWRTTHSMAQNYPGIIEVTAKPN